MYVAGTDTDSNLCGFSINIPLAHDIPVYSLHLITCLPQRTRLDHTFLFYFIFPNCVLRCL
jgi:hypothetical protein